jgi:glycosyltransferase involved in cell wall biosynthesis
MKRVLMVAWHFPPIGGPGTQRTSKYCKYLPQNGWMPTVIAGVEPEEHQDPSLLLDLPDGMRVERAPIPDTAWRRLRHFLFRRGMGRMGTEIGHVLDFPDTRREWAERFAVPTGRRLHLDHRFDALYTTAYWYSAHFAGMKLKAELGLPWVAELRDPWADNDLLLGHLPARIRRRHFAAEAAMVRAADAVIMAHPLAAESLRQRYPRYAEKVHAITNGYDPDDYADASSSAASRDHDGLITIVHTGSCYGSYGPGALFDALKEGWGAVADAVPTIRMRFIGGAGDAVPPNIPGIEFEVLPRVSHAEAIRAQRDADLLLNVFDRSVGRIGISGKLFEYMAAQRPILAVIPADGSTASIVADCGAGWVADCDHPEQIVSTMANAVRRVSSPTYVSLLRRRRGSASTRGRV